MVRLTDRPDMTLDIYRGRKTTIQYNTIQLNGLKLVHEISDNLQRKDI